MTESRFARVRKRLAPLVLVAAVALLAREACTADDRREVTVRFELGDGAALVRDLRVDLFVDGSPIAQLQRTRTAGVSLGAPEMTSVLPGEAVELRIELAVEAVAAAGAAPTEATAAAAPEVIPDATAAAAPAATAAAAPEAAAPAAGSAAELRRVVFTRRIHAEGGALVTIPLADEVARASATAR